MDRFKKLAVILTLGGASTAAAAGHQSGWPACSGFSEEVSDGPSLAWAFRTCRVDPTTTEIQLRFRNRARRTARLTYQIWLQRETDCRGRGSENMAGTAELKSGEVTPWPYLRHEIPADESFQGRVWVCVDGVVLGGGR